MDESKPIFNNFKKYFISTCCENFEKGILNYSFLNKVQRFNSYIENYNHRLKDLLNPFINKIGISVISWPVFLSLIKEEENFDRNLLYKLDINNLPIKSIENKYYHCLNNKNNNEINNNIIENKFNRLHWFINKNFSCRYDAFFLYFTLN